MVNPDIGMSGYTGWVNEILDQYKNTFKGVEKIVKSKTPLNTKQLALVEINQKLFRLGQNSVKFKLPLDGMLFDVDHDQSIQDTINDFIGAELNLPFKEIALEFLVEFENLKQSPFVVFAEEVDSEIQVLVFNRNSNNNWTSIRGLSISINRFNYTTHVDIHGKDEIMDGVIDDQELKSQVDTITQIAVSSIMQLLCALACTNVNISDDDVKPSTVKQTIRRSKGKLPFFSYKVLTVQIGKNSKESVKLNAYHTDDDEFIPSGKRAHLRRGHPRIYKTGLKIWVNSCSVANKKLGNVEKTYNIKP